MSRTTIQIGILGSILLAAHLLGLIQNTGSLTLLGWLTNPGTFNLSYILTSITSTLTLIGGAASAAIIVGLTLSQRIDLAIFAGIASIFLLVAWDIIAIYNGLKPINANFALLIISPIMLLYVLSVVEWLKGDPG